ncbi:hypothetical protein [Roseibium sp.]|uniref:hypothetical protein n=3 Tax=Roseibium sp. TaxID=1936156 RepID=UPI00326675BB
MPTTIERPPAAPVVAHATEYPPDRERRDDPRDEHNSKESRAQRHDPDTGSSDEAPAVLVDAEHHEDHRLDGVAAYRATAQHVLDPKKTTVRRPSTLGAPEHQAPETVRHAYEDHGTQEERHSLNVST